jgi:ankyrin repeat protein
MVAASAGHEDCVHLLLRAGALTGHADRWGRTALHLAAQNGHAAATQLLLTAGADPFIEDCKGENCDHGQSGGGCAVGVDERRIRSDLWRLCAETCC